MRSTAMVAVDCEMVLCEDGTEALIRVCVVDRDLKFKLDELVNPSKAVADYRTEITGVSAKDLDGVTCSLEDIQKSMKKLLSHGTILVGHSLNNDLQALKVDHARVIDTSLVFKYWNGSNFRRPSLNDLCKVPETDMGKLLLHRIPISIPGEKLHKIIPGDFKIEMKAKRKAGGDRYSAFAVFKNQEEANQAFEDVDGNQEKDSTGHSQKLISFQLGTGITGTLCVRKMARDDHLDQVASKKRSSQDETPMQTKKLKIYHTSGELEGADGHSDWCDSHLKEIERLKQELSLRDQEISSQLKESERLKKELSQRDQEISSLNKIVIRLTRKQGL